MIHTDFQIELDPSQSSDWIGFCFLSGKAAQVWYQNLHLTCFNGFDHIPSPVQNKNKCSIHIAETSKRLLIIQDFMGAHANIQCPNSKCPIVKMD
jgi:hypothetical protein